MKKLVILGAIVASMFMFVMGFYIVFTVEDSIMKWWFGGTCLIAGVAYALIAREKRKEYSFS